MKEPAHVHSHDAAQLALAVSCNRLSFAAPLAISQALLMSQNTATQPKRLKKEKQPNRSRTPGGELALPVGDDGAGAQDEDGLPLARVARRPRYRRHGRPGRRHGSPTATAAALAQQRGQERDRLHRLAQALRGLWGQAEY